MSSHPSRREFLQSSTLATAAFISSKADRCERPSVHDQSLLFGAFDPCADALVVGENQVNPGSAVKRGQRGVLLVEFDCQRASAISHRRCFLPSVALFFVSFVRLCDHIASGADEISRKLRDVSHVPIGDVVKSDRVKDLLLEGDLRSVIEGYYIGFLRLRKRLRGFIGCLKFYLQRESYLHIGKLNQVIRYCKRGLRYAKPSRNADLLCRL